uniref:Uncharacterized protein n=1 Tax=Davidia involucrata TaxID=16924 RepID=A0A5B7BWM3_DAVIN
MCLGGRKDRQMRERRLYKAALSGSVESFEELINEDTLILARVPVTSFKDRPLHIVTMLGHTDFAIKLLSHNSNLANELNTEGHLPLHLASANGYIEIVQMLLLVNIDACHTLNKDERTLSILL